MSEKLKPCPFCKGEFAFDFEIKKFRCGICGATVPPDPYGRTVNTRPIEDDLRKRIAELEEKHKVAFGLVRKLRMYCFNANWEYSDPEEADEFDEFDAEVCEYLSEYKEREE